MIKLLKLWPNNGALMKRGIFKINFCITPRGILRLKFYETRTFLPLDHFSFDHSLYLRNFYFDGNRFFEVRLFLSIYLD